MSTHLSQEKLSGIIERVTFHSVETGWSVLKVSQFQNSNQMVTVLIHQAEVYAGASMDFWGSWVSHQKFGQQFKASRSLEKKPASSAALEKYLGSGLIKGVGPKTAKKIVKYFGAKTLEVFEGDMAELLEVPSIAKKKLSQISKSWEEHKSIRDVMIFLQTHGVSSLFAVKIFKIYGQEAIKIVSDNPYRLSKDVYGIGFFSADKIALCLGFKPNGIKRIEAGIKHVLAASRDEGHCFLFRQQIIENTLELLSIQESELIELRLKELLLANEIKKRDLPNVEGGSVEAFYSKTLYFEEERFSKEIISRCTSGELVSVPRMKDWLTRYCEKESFNLSEEQRNAALSISGQKFSILTGGPGCGKTTTTKSLVALLKAMKKNVTLAAPTGRAAQRMAEVIGFEAKTIHRLLEWDPRAAGFKRNKDFQLDTDFLVVDECSMLDISLAASLIVAVPPEAQVLFIGDPDQLPSVGPGAVLQNLLAAPAVAHYRLTQIFRQAQASNIVLFAHEINQGRVPRVESPIARPEIWSKEVDCLFIDAEEATSEQIKFIARAKAVISSQVAQKSSVFVQHGDKIVGEVDVQLEFSKIESTAGTSLEDLKADVFSVPEKFQHVNIEHLINSDGAIEELKSVLKSVHPWSTLNFGFTALDSLRRLYSKTIFKKLGPSAEIQILTPQVRGSLGSLNLNRVIQNDVNPFKHGQPQLIMGDRIFRENDRVIQTRNNYDLNVFNGDIGRIRKIDPTTLSCEVRFGASEVPVIYQKEDMGELALAYAITIHKSQGSEFEAVIIPVATQHFRMLFRNLIYTGLTRAKKLAVFVGSRKALALAVKSLNHSNRQTALEYLLTRGH